MADAGPIRISLDGVPEIRPADAKSAILVPALAVDEPGHIQTLPGAPDSSAKHDLHQLSQLALLDFEDGELAPRLVSDDASIVVESDAGSAALGDGLVVYRDPAGAPGIIAHQSAPIRALLSNAHRFCTRWIRLDVT